MDAAAYFRAMGALLAVVGVIYVLGWSAKRLRMPQRLRQNAPRLVARLPLGARASLAVVDIEGERLVIGVTGQQVSLLSRQTLPDLPQSGNGDVPAPIDTEVPSFVRMLRQCRRDRIIPVSREQA